MKWMHTEDRDRRTEFSPVPASIESRRIQHRADYESLLLAGRLQYLAGEYPKAIAFYLKAMLFSPEDPGPLYGLKDCYVATGDPAAASRMVLAIRVAEERAARRTPMRGL
jgi:tetratricopeptide (TPR) repeat protein